MATIRDVAKHAGVSVATVSRVLNNNGYVNDETRKKVMSSIERLEYQPNELARSLYKRSSKMIGLIVPDIMNPFFPELARAVEDIATRKEYTFVLCNSDDQLVKEQKYFNVLKQKYVDGFIVVTSTLTAEHTNGMNVPIVALDRPIAKHIPSFMVDNYEGAKIAVQHLLDNGCKKIAHIRGPEQVYNAKLRLQGYIDTVSHYPWFNENLIVTGNYNLSLAKEVAIKLLKNNPDVDGIFAGNDVMAIGVIKAAEELGINVPNQLAIVGFDGISLGETTSPTLTTIQQPIYEMGSKATELLIKIIEKDRTLQDDLHVQYPAKLLKRQSTQRKA
ncbi:LacI family transcriptional regulator [Radiobacillus kanasensis]|uniref:LacI family DNA-binding transcriptional regulator n=1 Tax=Radiobacillus kanasensis TaxID=2844358 RepID=UPI001E49CA5E|nr:LacI family DNA-binding transcriptional regulator [Radiobacillus kanasensis]UFT98818.1 LacI family transcriptional regulator [Radiobacillus kanasensis]